MVSLKQLYDILVVQRLVAQFDSQAARTPSSGGILGVIGSVLGGIFNSGGPGDTTGAYGLPPSFAGGGFTGTGTRSGGIDGKGGGLAIVHPNETIVDHSSPNNQSSGGDVYVNQSINISTGVAQTVRAEVAALMPQIANASKSAVLDARRRGGSFASAF